MRLVSLNDFIDDCILAPSSSVAKCDPPSGSTATGYLAQYPLFDNIPALARDIVTPDLVAAGNSDDGVVVNAWFGPQGTVSPMHFDPKDNLFAQARPILNALTRKGCRFQTFSNPPALRVSAGLSPRRQHAQKYEPGSRRPAIHDSSRLMCLTSILKSSLTSPTHIPSTSTFSPGIFSVSLYLRV